MDQAITVKYLNATAKTPARYKAMCTAGASFVHAGDYETEQAAASAAVLKLLKRFRWDGVYYAGRMPDGRAVFVKPNSFRVEVAE